MPEDCMFCKFFVCGTRDEYCVAVDGQSKIPNEVSIPDWCPIKQLPKKDINSYFPDEYQDGYAEGWNACIDALGGQ